MIFFFSPFWHSARDDFSAALNMVEVWRFSSFLGSSCVSNINIDRHENIPSLPFLPENQSFTHHNACESILKNRAASDENRCSQLFRMYDLNTPLNNGLHSGGTCQFFLALVESFFFFFDQQPLTSFLSLQSFVSLLPLGEMASASPSCDDSYVSYSQNIYSAKEIKCASAMLP